MNITHDMVNRFLTWPLPESVCADLCATKQGAPHRSGTNLLSYTEARQMLAHVVREVQDGSGRVCQHEWGLIDVDHYQSASVCLKCHLRP